MTLNDRSETTLLQKKVSRSDIVSKFTAASRSAPCKGCNWFTRFTTATNIRWRRWWHKSQLAGSLYFVVLQAWLPLPLRYRTCKFQFCLLNVLHTYWILVWLSFVYTPVNGSSMVDWLLISWYCYNNLNETYVLHCFIMSRRRNVSDDSSDDDEGKYFRIISSWSNVLISVSMPVLIWHNVTCGSSPGCASVLASC